MVRGLRELGDRVEVAFREVEAFLDSPIWRRLRRILAAGAIVAVPLLFRLPGFRRYPLIRTLELVGGAALIVRFAEALRDWEPASKQPVVIDIGSRAARRS